MSEFRDLQAKLEKINESYYSRLAAAADDIALYNQRMPDDELIALVNTELGDQAAQYISDKLASGEGIEENFGDWIDDLTAPSDEREHRYDHDPSFHDDVPISAQVKSLLAQGKSVISRISGASGVVYSANPEDGTIVFKDQNIGEKIGFDVDSKSGLELKGFVDHYAIVQNVDEAVVEVPAGLRGEDAEMGGATSRDAERFLADLSSDDSVDTEVIDPESGEVLDWPTKDTRQAQDDAEYDKQEAERQRQEDEEEDSIFSTPYIPGAQTKRDVGGVQSFDGMDRAQEDLGKLRWDSQITDFYDITWKNIEDLVDEPQQYYDGDYDIGWDMPVSIKRTDGQRFTDEDHDNFRRLTSLFKAATFNIGIQYVGSTDSGLVARFIPTFH